MKIVEISLPEALMTYPYLEEQLEEARVWGKSIAEMQGEDLYTKWDNLFELLWEWELVVREEAGEDISEMIPSGHLYYLHHSLDDPHIVWVSDVSEYPAFTPASPEGLKI